MKLSSWFSSLSSDALTQHTTGYVVSNIYHPLFMSFLLRMVKNTVDTSFVYLGLSDRQNEIEHQLSMLFLGQQQWYWLGSLDMLSTQQRLFWMKYLTHYSGPHVIWCHTKEQVSPTQSRCVITLPEMLDYKEFENIARCLFSTLSDKKCRLFCSLFKEQRTLSLDSACIIMQYARVLSVQQIPEFINEWIDVLFVTKYSLFTLSALFFAKDFSKFFSMWASLSRVYSVHFWISYWSEQVFRSHQYICAKHAKDIISAKKYAYRLPFSFIQRDWKKYTTEELREAHQRLYDLDFRLKQGGDERFLDLWIYQFLTS